MNVVIYIRISTKKQSFEAQKKICNDYVTKYQYNVVQVIEEACSAYTKNKQTKLIKLLDNIEKHKIKINKIIVSMYDRFSRNIEFASRAVTMLKNNNVMLESAVGNIPDSMSPLGMKLMLNAFVDAQYESILIGERLRMMYTTKKLVNLLNKDSTSGEDLLSKLRNKDLTSGEDSSSESQATEKILALATKQNTLKNFVKFVRNTKDIYGKQLLAWINKLKKINNSDSDMVNQEIIVVTNDSGKVIHSTNWNSFDVISLKDDIIYNFITYNDIASLLNKYSVQNENGKTWTSLDIIKINKQNTKKRKNTDMTNCDQNDEPIVKRKRNA